MPAFKGCIPPNKGKSQGQKRGFTPQQVRMIFDHLASRKDENPRYLRDLALFAVGVDTMLRASDLLKLRVSDVSTPEGVIKERFSLQQKKTGEAHQVALSQGTREILKEWLESENKYGDDFIFTRTKKRRGKNFESIQPNQYRLLVKQWGKIACVKDVREVSTHSLRRTKAQELWRRTGNVEAVRLALGQSDIASTSHYLGLGKSGALDLVEKIEFFK